MRSERESTIHETTQNHTNNISCEFVSIRGSLFRSDTYFAKQQSNHPTVTAPHASLHQPFDVERHAFSLSLANELGINVEDA